MCEPTAGPVVSPCFPAARQRRMFHPPAKPPQAAVVYRTTVPNARRHDRAGGGGEFYQKLKFGDCQLNEDNNFHATLFVLYGDPLMEYT